MQISKSAAAVAIKTKEGIEEQISSALQSKNIRIHRRRTSIRLEPRMWSALQEIARQEQCSINHLCSAVHDLKEPVASFTAALRVFLMEYFRSGEYMTPHIRLVQKLAKKYKKASGI